MRSSPAGVTEANLQTTNEIYATRYVLALYPYASKLKTQTVLPENFDAFYESYYN